MSLLYICIYIYCRFKIHILLLDKQLELLRFSWKSSTFFLRAASTGWAECYLGKTKRKTNQTQKRGWLWHGALWAAISTGVWRLQHGRAAPSKVGVMPVPTGPGVTAQARPARRNALGCFTLAKHSWAVFWPSCAPSRALSLPCSPPHHHYLH